MDTDREMCDISPSEMILNKRTAGEVSQKEIELKRLLKEKGFVPQDVLVSLLVEVDELHARINMMESILFEHGLE